jgi:hypothetical protein
MRNISYPFLFATVILAINFGCTGKEPLLDEPPVVVAPPAPKDTFLQKMIDLGMPNIEPILSTETPEGKIHVLFFVDGTISSKVLGSVLLSRELEVESVKGYTNFSLNWDFTSFDATRDGGFVFAFLNRVYNLNKSQELNSFQGFKWLYEPSNAFSKINTIRTIENGYVGLGSSWSPIVSAPSTIYLGLIKFDLEGKITEQRVHDNSSFSNDVKQFQPQAAVQRKDGRIIASSGTSVNSVLDLTSLEFASIPRYPYDVDAVGNNVFVTSRNHYSSGDSLSIFKLNESLEMVQELPIGKLDFHKTYQKPCISSDEKELAIMFSYSKDSIEFSGYDANTLSDVPVFQTHLGLSGGEVTTYSLQSLKSGYLISATYKNAAGENLLYIIKTDKRGKIQ